MITTIYIIPIALCCEKLFHYLTENENHLMIFLKTKNSPSFPRKKNAGVKYRIFCLKFQIQSEPRTISEIL